MPSGSVPSILVIDDDIHILELIQTRLEAARYEVETYFHPLNALEALRDRTFDVVVTDIRMPDLDGLEVLRRIKRLGCQAPVILLTAYGTIPSAVEAMREGAFQYLTKPFQGKQLVEEIQRALLESGRLRCPPEAGNGYQFPGVFGVSAAMKALYPRLQRIMESDSTVLIQGESGTGKELIAQMIHRNSDRKANRFVIVDCGATPSSLIESELFGHVKGAFTNATENRKGIFEVADKGTLFLDEIGSLPLELQTRLLRVLQEGQIKRIGENQMRNIDVRVIAATNVDLQRNVQEGLFRLDLYYRLAVLTVALPPLRERKEDLPLLADHFLESFASKAKKGPMKWEKGAKERLTLYEWPGNIRELKNTVEAGVIYSEDGVLSLESLHWAGLPREVAPAHEATPLPASPQGQPGFSLPEFVEAQERRLIVEALEANKGVQRGAAKQLGISPRVLNYKIKKLKIPVSA